MRGVLACVLLGASLAACPSTDALLVDPPSVLDAGPPTTDASAIDGATDAAPVTLKSCAVYASPKGSDEDPGTQGKPVRTLTKLHALAKENDLACLFAGTYEGILDISRPNLRFTEAGDGKVILTGITIQAGAETTTLEALSVKGGQGSTAVVSVLGRGALLRRLDISGVPKRLCVQIGVEPVDAVTIERTRVHNCGSAILAPKATHLTITDSVVDQIDDNAIVLGANIYDSRIERSIVFHTESGITIYGDGTSPSTRNVIKDSIIADSRKWGFRSDGMGPDNRLDSNCFAQNVNGQDAGAGFTESSSRIEATAEDIFVAPAGDPEFKLAPDSPCRGKGPSAE